MKKKHSLKRSPLSWLTYYVIGSLILFIALITALILQNARITKLEKQTVSAKSSISTEDPTLPVCDKPMTGMSTYGGNGESILSLDDNMLTLEGHSNSTFHICNNAKVYDVVTGKQLDMSALKVGTKVWIKTTDANWIKQIQVVSQS